MGIAHEHEIHKRRLGRNLGIGLSLAAFVALVFALTIAKAPGNVKASAPETKTEASE